MNIAPTPWRVRYSVQEAAEMLGLHVDTVRRRIRTKDLHIVRDGGRVFITHDELVRYGTRDFELPEAG